VHGFKFGAMITDSGVELCDDLHVKFAQPQHAQMAMQNLTNIAATLVSTYMKYSTSGSV
jgi:hypothetical protein